MSDKNRNSEGHTQERTDDLDPSAPFSGEQIEAMLDQVVRELENETPEEAAARHKEYDLLLRDNPELAVAMEGLREIFGSARPSEKISGNSCKGDDSPALENNWRDNPPPKPRNPFDTGVFDYFFQRGATVSYQAVDGRRVEKCLKGWRYGKRSD